MRCADKGLECVYESARTTTIKGNLVEESLAQIDTPSAFSQTSSTDSFAQKDIFALGDGVMNEVQAVDVDWDTFSFATDDVTPSQLHNPVANDADDRRIVDNFYANVDPKYLSLTKLPWKTGTSRVEHFSFLTRPINLPEPPYSEFLARLPISDPVANFSATVVMQMLRAFPQMMLRRETLPPFIHGHWYRPSSTTNLSLPEPLVNCMGIAQIFASDNAESKPFLWRTVRMEQRSFLEKVCFIDLLLDFQPQQRSKLPP